METVEPFGAQSAQSMTLPAHVCQGTLIVDAAR